MIEATLTIGTQTIEYTDAKVAVLDFRMVEKQLTEAAVTGSPRRWVLNGGDETRVFLLTAGVPVELRVLIQMTDRVAAEL